MNKKIRKYTVKLSESSLIFAQTEGEEIAKAKKLSHLDPKETREKKIANSTFGTYAQQLLIEQIGARRVTKEECPGYHYDVVTDHQKLLEFFGWEPSWEWRSKPESSVEIKSLHTEGRGWISFYDENVAHALKCARYGWFDYLTAFGVNVINEKDKIAEVSLLGIVAPAALTNPETYVRSGHNFGQHYLQTSKVHQLGLGKIFI